MGFSVQEVSAAKRATSIMTNLVVFPWFFQAVSPRSLRSNTALLAFGRIHELRNSSSTPTPQPRRCSLPAGAGGVEAERRD